MLTQGKHSRARLLEVGLAAVYVLLRAGSFTNVPGPATDTPSYEAVARLHLWDWRFYAAQRGFTIPLFYKLVPGAEARIVAQLTVSVVAWLALASVVAHSLRNRTLRAVTFAAVLGVSLTWEVIRWDGLLLSESLTLSLTALLLAAGIVLARTRSSRWACAFGVVALLWVFARDTNAYVLLVAGAAVAVTLVRPGHRQLKGVLAVTCAIIFVAAYGSSDLGRRWLQPMRDIVAHRVLQDPAMLAYFERRGFDPHSNWPVADWMVERSRSVYADWLLSHPKYTFVRPVHGYENTLWSNPRNLEALVDPNLEIYDAGASHRLLTMPRPLERILFPRGTTLVGALAVLSLLMGGLAAYVGARTAAALVPLAIFVTTYPHFLVVWHQSGLEVDRHALAAALLLRLGILLLGAYALDALLTRTPILRRSRSTTPRSTRSVDAAGS